MKKITVINADEIKNVFYECPACGAKTSAEVLDKLGARIRECPGCNAPIPDPASAMVQSFARFVRTEGLGGVSFEIQE